MGINFNNVFDIRDRTWLVLSNITEIFALKYFQNVSNLKVVFHIGSARRRELNQCIICFNSINLNLVQSAKNYIRTVYAKRLSRIHCTYAMSSDVLSSALRQFQKSMRQKFDFQARNDAQSQIVLRLPQSYRTSYLFFKSMKNASLENNCIWGKCVQNSFGK